MAVVAGDETGLLKIIDLSKNKVMRTYGKQSPVRRIDHLCYSGILDTTTTTTTITTTSDSDSDSDSKAAATTRIPSRVALCGQDEILIGMRSGLLEAIALPTSTQHNDGDIVASYNGITDPLAGATILRMPG
jgi:hypothetical protein